MAGMALPSSVYASSPATLCGGGTGIDTALGCISFEPAALLGQLFVFAIGIAGGAAFLAILFGGFHIQTSAGNPKRLAAGREMVESAIAGLLLIVFSVFILKVVGIDILSIPGFQ